MRELRLWLIVFLLIAGGWIALYVVARLTIEIPPNEPPEAFGVAPLFLALPFLVMILSTAVYSVVAMLRALFVGAGLAQTDANTELRHYPQKVVVSV